MAGHIQDRWYKTKVGPDGKTRKMKTDRYGSGARYRARYVGPDGTEKSKSFPDRQKRLADQWLAHIEADMARGQYIDPRAARITFQQYAETWVETQGADPNTQASMESQLRLHAFPHLGSRPLGSFQPAHIRDWVRKLQENGVRGRPEDLLQRSCRPECCGGRRAPSAQPVRSPLGPAAHSRHEAGRPLDNGTALRRPGRHA